MGFWLNAWAGDNAGPIVGRQPYQALVALTYTTVDDIPWEVLLTKGDLDGTPWYSLIDVSCLTPNARKGIVTKVEDVGANAYSLEIIPYKFGEDTKVSWEPGVHLFSVSLGYGTSGSAAIATVVVPPEIRKELSLSDQAVQKMLEMRQRTRLRYSGLGGT